MILGLEIKKLRRTGYIPAILVGALLSSAFPAVNMAVRSEHYTALSQDPFVILSDANWQMMGMLNMLLSVCAACIMYHTEYADNGVQKMGVLPIRAGRLFLGKFLVAAVFQTIAVLMEMTVLEILARYWFPEHPFDPAELLQNTGFSLLMMLPTIMLMLVIASFCQNMWVSLGIGVILVFLLSILPENHLFLDLCPFRSPYQLLERVKTDGHTVLFSAVCTAETILAGMLEFIFLKIRRCFL